MALAAALVVTGACDRPAPGCTGAYCGTLVIAAIGEPHTLLPPVTEEIVARDIEEQLFLKLADVGMSLNTVGDEDFQPVLAERWEWDGPLTLVFHLDPRARWHDGRPVTAADVEFTYNAYTDPRVASPFRTALQHIASVTQRDSLTAVFRFRERYPEMFYDAVYHMRVLPAHLLVGIPREQWRTSPFGRRPVGNGPYRFVSWRAAEAVELVADSTFYLGRPRIRRLIWRFVPDMTVGVSQLLAGQADIREQVLGTENIQRLRAAPHITLHSYRGNSYGFLGFNLSADGDTATPHPIFGDRVVRRAIAMLIDRGRLVRSVLGDFGRVPPGPMSSLLWIWDDELRQLPYDTAQAARLLAARGWRDRDGDGIRDREGQPLSFRLSLPTTSAPRRQYARLLQEQFRLAGVRIEIDEWEPAVLSERLRDGRFDAALLARGNDPSPSSGMRQSWTRAGLGGSNQVRYHSATFDRLVDRAISARSRAEAEAAWRAAVETINADAPGVFLYALDNVAAVHSRVENVKIRADSWAALLWTWRIPADQMIERDRVGR
ncbi:MAG: ABC transporter substrate-binding protein [Gemmatimonadales bacterium]